MKKHIFGQTLSVILGIALIMSNCSKKSNESEIKELLRETQLIPQCEEVYFLAGQCGVLVKVNVPEINELDALVENFRGRSDVRSVERVCVVLKPIKTHTQNGGMRI